MKEDKDTEDHQIRLDLSSYENNSKTSIFYKNHKLIIDSRYQREVEVNDQIVEKVLTVENATRILAMMAVNLVAMMLGMKSLLITLSMTMVLVFFSLRDYIDVISSKSLSSVLWHK